MHCQFSYQVYRRPFKQPLHTVHGLWSDREGIILQLCDRHQSTSFGEIAPLPWFGSESLEEALMLCSQLSQNLSWQEIQAIPDTHPACQFGFESAWEMMASPPPQNRCNPSLASSYLLPTGAAALTEAASLQSTGEGIEQTVKWKIGVASLEEEMTWFDALVRVLPTKSKLRLDANGGLTWEQACRWLERCDRLQTSSSSLTLEFIEQPLPPHQFDDLLKLQQTYVTAIALDESVATVAQMEQCYDQGWRGIFVVKAAIAGSPQRLRQFCQRSGVDLVWSSVFETAIAQQYIKAYLIPSISTPLRAIGFGVNQWFEE
jgi:o-succinylbenzoate synthase